MNLVITPIFQFLVHATKVRKQPIQHQQKQWMIPDLPPSQSHHQQGTYLMLHLTYTLITTL